MTTQEEVIHSIIRYCAKEYNENRERYLDENELIDLDLMAYECKVDLELTISYKEVQLIVYQWYDKLNLIQNQ